MRLRGALSHLLAERPGPLRLIGVHDALSARLAERAGARALWISGLCIAASKGLPDNESVTYETLLRRTADIRRGSGLPLLVDGNTGFGGEQVIGHVVQELELRGAAGISIEDKAFPRRNSFDRDADRPESLEHPEIVAARLRQACLARRDPDFLIVARTEGLIAGETPPEVRERGKRYVEAGADALIVHSKSGLPDEVIDFAREWPLRDCPLIVIPTTYPQLSFTRADQAGISGVICANQALRAAHRATDEHIRQLLKADRLCDAEAGSPLAPMPELLDMVESFGSVRPGSAST
ncbi:isocitrate lyase/phosphoenolpyruvate mutase family protein [Streptomyces sp. NPDC006335]|uniref:isocitrate lyase/phosphoenolpyruvate mutase family protein n=1 Tax=Streptomyces sp. NPDC006335 TaxID=3156895 RepID=UPI0033AB387B